MTKLYFLILLTITMNAHAELPSNLVSGTYKGTGIIEKTDSSGTVTTHNFNHCELWVDNTDKILPLSGDYTLFNLKGCYSDLDEIEFSYLTAIEINSNSVIKVLHPVGTTDFKILESELTSQYIKYLIGRAVSNDYGLVYSTSIFYTSHSMQILSESQNLDLKNKKPISTYKININLNLFKTY